MLLNVECMLTEHVIGCWMCDVAQSNSDTSTNQMVPCGSPKLATKFSMDKICSIRLARRFKHPTSLALIQILTVGWRLLCNPTICYLS
jgi:hypothetical protein